MRMALVTRALLLAGPPLTYFALGARAAFDRHAFAAIDRNGDGQVTLSDVVAGSDIGRRPITVAGRVCTEVFAFKDGRPVRTDCPG